MCMCFVCMLVYQHRFVYVCINAYIFTYIYIYTYTHIHAYTHKSWNTCMTCAQSFIYIYIYIHNIYIYVHIRTRAETRVCQVEDMRAKLYIYIYIYIYIYTNKSWNTCMSGGGHARKALHHGGQHTGREQRRRNASPNETNARTFRGKWQGPRAVCACRCNCPRDGSQDRQRHFSEVQVWSFFVTYQYVMLLLQSKVRVNTILGFVHVLFFDSVYVYLNVYVIVCV